MDVGADEGSLGHGDDEYGGGKPTVVIDEALRKLNKWDEVSEPWG